MSKYDDYSTNLNFEVPEVMQALIAKGRGFENLEVAQIPVPEINADQLLARIDARERTFLVLADLRGSLISSSLFGGFDIL